MGFMNKIKLPNVTCIIIDDVDFERAKKSIEECEKYVEFGSIKYLSSIPQDYKYFVKLDEPIDSIIKYSEFCLKNLVDYFSTDYVLIIQHDGYIVNPESWDSQFLEYDYIGSPIPYLPHTPDEPLNIVGNGGFSLRSKRLMVYTSKFIKMTHDTNDNSPKIFSEDIVISISMRNLLERKGFKFAPFELALKFGVEGFENLEQSRSFGFHGFEKKYVGVDMKERRILDI